MENINKPIFCDSIDIDPNFVSSPQLPTISLYFTTQITHYFRSKDANEYLYTHIHYGKYHKKIDLLKENIFVEYSNQSQKYLKCLKSHLIQQINGNDIFFSSIVPTYLPFGKRYIATYFVCGVDVDVKKRKKHISKTPIKRIQTQQPLFNNTKLFELLGYELNDKQLKITRNNTYQLLKFLKNSDKITIKDISTIQRIVKPVHYVNSVDSISIANNEYHCNTLYLFCSISKFKQQINDLLDYYKHNILKRTETFEKIYDLIINYAIALFYINLSNDNCIEEDFNVYNIFYIELFLINSWLFNKNCFTMDGGNIDTLYRKTTKKFDRIFNIGIYNYLNGVLGIVGVGCCNKCLFPSNWTKEEKDLWKEENGIERKKRKDETKSRKTKIDRNMIRRIKRAIKNGTKKVDICRKENISKPTLNKIIKSL